MFYVVPFENESYIVHGTESRVLTDEDLDQIRELMIEGMTTQKALEKVWTS